MKRFHVGDRVRVAGLPSSEWQERHGTIVELFEHLPQEPEDISQECAVDFGGERRWFLSRHLVKTVQTKFVRFFRAEVMNRWHLEAGDVANLNGDLHDLVALLRHRLDFAVRRAEAEVDDFYIEFDEMIARAVCSSPSARLAMDDVVDARACTEICKRTTAA